MPCNSLNSLEQIPSSEARGHYLDTQEIQLVHQLCPQDPSKGPYTEQS